uniref:Ig-like domain-containing protein n=1 Tax=Oryzias latipes TaxID=8090 RepID=A0A3P9IS40_ORYLA
EKPWTNLTFIFFINDSVCDSDCNFLFLLVSPAGYSDKTVYKRVGEDVTLPCDVYRSYKYDVKWLIYRPEKPDFESISCNGNVQNSDRASRLSVSSDCSLLITNITVEDADQYTCRPANNNHNDAVVYLNTLSSEYSDLNNSVYMNVNILI